VNTSGEIILRNKRFVNKRNGNIGTCKGVGLVDVGGLIVGGLHLYPQNSVESILKGE
jgi:hypothetical protein